jgi:hypothetical protein
MKKKKTMPFPLSSGIKYALMAAAVAAMLTGGIRSSLAWDVPGFDELYDPPNYYSLTSISWPDSAPSPFALRDLADQGGAVYDYTREMKSILFGDNFKSIIGALMEKLGIDIINHKPLAADILDHGIVIASENQRRVDEIYQMEAWKRMEETPIFHHFDESEQHHDAPRARAAQRRLLSDTYSAYAEGAQLAISDHAESDALMQKLLKALENAQGEKEIRQIATQIEALSAAEAAKRTALLGALTELKATVQREELDKALEHQRLVERAKVIVADPFDKAAVQASGYERRKPLGFVPFE